MSANSKRVTQPTASGGNAMPADRVALVEKLEQRAREMDNARPPSVTPYRAEVLRQDAALLREAAALLAGPTAPCAICHKPQPCAEHGRTPVTPEDFDDLSRDVAQGLVEEPAAPRCACGQPLTVCESCARVFTAATKGPTAPQGEE